MSDVMKSIKIVCIAVFLLLTPFSYSAASTGADYAALPPFLTAAVKPNVVIVMDFSGSMQDQAYYPGSFEGYNNETYLSNPFNTPIGAEYDSEESYYGYFDPDAYYTYNDGDEYWEKDGNSPYENGEIGDEDSLSGNFLNFIVTSRMDAAYKSLIGGKANCPEGEDYCRLDSQGARRSVEISDSDGHHIADFWIRPENYTTGTYADKRILITLESAGEEYNLSTFSNRYASVKIAAEERRGIVQDNAENVRFSFIPYADSNNDVDEGTILHGGHEEDIGSMIAEMEDAIPYSGTHTGEAMREAHRYLKQESLATRNSDYQDKESVIDPYYEKREEKEGEPLEPAWCRKSYVVLISDGEWNGSIDPVLWANDLHTKDLRDDSDFPGMQNAEVYTLFCFTGDEGGLNSMQSVAAFGSWDPVDGCADGPYGLDLNDDSRDVSFPIDACNPEGTYDACCAQWDKTGDGIPDAFFNVRDGDDMEAALTQIFREIRQGSSSGTSVTAITSRANTGTLVSQAAFYPEKDFTDDITVNWVGNIFASWYLNAYIDGNLIQNIREDTNENYVLDVEDDRILDYRVEQDVLQIDAYDSDSDGTKASNTPAHSYTVLEDVGHLFDVGEKLKVTLPSDRKIFTVAEGIDGDVLEEFKVANTNRDKFTAFLGVDHAFFPDCLLDSTDPNYDDLIDYTRGSDIEGCRVRVADTSGTVWKLGDIISSTPTVVNYGDYRIIFSGSNSGMLHAFRMGYLKNRGETLRPSELWDDANMDSREMLGREEWAFIPKNSLPYLRYMADPNYDHIYTVDSKPFIITTEDMTVLIGGMRLGGATGNGPLNPPEDTDPVGLSSYFALNISDPESPEFLWEFTDQDLGLTYSGPAYVRRKNAANDAYNHYVIFASGPTNHDGTSVQPLKVFVLDLETGVLEKTFDGFRNDAFGGRLFTEGLDLNNDRQTDFVLLGFTEKADQTGGDFEQMEGGVVKIYTGAPEPDGWEANVMLSGAIGDAVTGPIKVKNCFPDVQAYPYLYFGSGRYFLPDDRTQRNVNDNNHLYGVPFTCDINNANCSQISSITKAADLSCENVYNIEKHPGQAAWKIELDLSENHYLRERCYTAPATTDYDIVFFDTMKPSDVICQCGGKSRSWAVNCATGRGLDYNIFQDDPSCGLDEISGNDYMVDPDLAFKYLTQTSDSAIHQSGRDEFDGGDRGATDEVDAVPGDDPSVPLFPPGKDYLQYWKQW